MPGAVDTTYTFTATDTITSTKMNNIIDETVMTSESCLSGGGLEVASGKLTISANAINSSRLAANSVSSSNIVDGTIVNADINASAAISPSKLGSGALTSTATVTTSNIIDASITAPKLNGAQTGSAPIFGVRAWASFDGRFTQVTGKAYTRSGTIVTVTNAGHGLSTGNILSISSATDTGLNTLNNVTASVKITIVDSNNFTFQTTSTGASTGTLTYAIGGFSSANVSSISRIATGTWTITFSTGMDDANYCVLANAKHATGVNIFTNTWPTGLTSTTFDLNVMRDTGVAYNSEYISFIVMK